MFVITGGSSGIGFALARALVARDQKVCVIGRRVALLQEAAQYSPRISYIEADIATEAGCKHVASVLKKCDRLNGLVNNAGVIEPIAPIARITREAWHKLMSTNLDAPLFLTQLLQHQLIGGRVLNIGSGAAYFAIEGWAAYCISKAALSMLTRCWQLECPEISCASVMPGIVDTAMQAVIRGSTSMASEKHAFFVKLKKEHQLLTVTQVANFLVTLLLDTDATTYSSKEWDIYETNAQYPEE